MHLICKAVLLNVGSILFLSLLSHKTFAMMETLDSLDNYIPSNTITRSVPSRIFQTFRLEDKYVEKKNKDYWVIKNHESFIKVSKKLINEDGSWRGEGNCPRYVRYFDVKEGDLPYIEKWLGLDGLEYFGISAQKKSADFDLIYPWYTQLVEKKSDLKKLGVYKLIWLSSKSTLEALNFNDGDIPQEWLENHRIYYLESSHY